MPRIRQQSNTAEVAEIERPSITIAEKRARRSVEQRLPIEAEPFKWKPGQSGNPGGKPKVLAEILALGHRNTVAIMERLIDAALNHQDANVWIPAAREVLNRTFGKPSQQVEVIGGVEHRHFVLRAPAVLESSDAWEAKYGAVIDASVAEPAKNEPDAPGELVETPAADASSANDH